MAVRASQGEKKPSPTLGQHRYDAERPDPGSGKAANRPSTNHTMVKTPSAARWPLRQKVSKTADLPSAEGQEQPDHADTGGHEPFEPQRTGGVGRRTAQVYRMHRKQPSHTETRRCGASACLGCNCLQLRSPIKRCLTLIVLSTILGCGRLWKL